MIGWHSFQFYSCFTKVLQLVQLHCSSNHIFQMPYMRLKTLPLHLLDWPANNFLANCKSVLMWNHHDISEQQQFAGISSRLTFQRIRSYTCSHSSCTGPCLHHDTFFALQSKNSSKSLSSLLLLFSSCDCFWRLLVLDTFSWIILCLSRKESARK